MIPFYRKIRKQLADEKKPLKYLRYAVGEMLLVVIGILIALQINNWNENRKDQNRTEKLFQNLEANLRTDSVALAGIITIIGNSLEKQEIIISTSSEALLDTYNKEELRKTVREIWAGFYSFDPKLGVYNQLLSSNLMDLIESDEIKEALRDYYDYRCPRYVTVDHVLDIKYHETFHKFLAEDLAVNYFGNMDDLSSSPEFSLAMIDKLKTECRNVYDLTYAVYGILEELKKDIDKLLVLIDNELGPYDTDP
ncbi:MAG: hypothetical protein E4H10_06710 [Bacteroidia bacterium]|nr:MAG: hypothetical protein E4H10_06710 [Bacteroidia bacterium]